MHNIPLFVLLAVLLVCHRSSAEFSCKTYNAPLLFGQATKAANAADKALLDSGRFARVVNGFAVVIVGPDTGETNAGGTNPLGAYMTYIADSTEIFADGQGKGSQQVCDAVPACTNSTQVQVCNPRCFNPNNNSTDTISMMLGPADAVVFTGCAPPPMKYYSFDQYIIARTTEAQPYYPGTNFGDSLSLDDIQGDDTEGYFDKSLTVIQSGDEAVLQAVTKAYEDVGVAKVKQLGVDFDTVRAWDRSQGFEASRPDMLDTVMRMAVPDGGMGADSPAFQYSAVAWPVRFYMADDAAKTEQPFKPHIKSRTVAPDGTAVPDEKALYTPALKDLADVVSASYAADGYSLDGSLFLNGTAIGFYDDWDAILARKDNSTFILPTRDAIYGMPVQGPVRFGQVAQATFLGIRKPGATYHELMLEIYDMKAASMTTITLLDKDMANSAERYLRSSSSVIDETDDLLFAVDLRVQGACAGAKYCWELPEGVSPENAFVSLGERVYLDKTTKVGPPGTSLLSVGLVFKKSK